LEKALPGEVWVQDCSAATENILLAAESMGLGAVWTGAYPSQERIDCIRKVLGMPENIVPLNVIPVGYPVGDENPKDKFDPANVHWEKW
jgi:nitroreductase